MKNTPYNSKKEKRFFVTMSVNFLKVKNRSTARALMKHCDKTERIKNNHSNGDIDKVETNNNLQLYNESLDESMNRFTSRISMLDSSTNGNKRKDRIELFSLNVPIPHGIPEREFFYEVCKAFKNDYGEQNVINMYLHTDEQHTYIDSSSLTTRTSLCHIHAFVVPEINGTINGRLFSSKSRMQSVNKALDNFCRKTYGIPFLTGGKKTQAKVEDLKKSSSELAEEVLSKLKEETPASASKTITGDIKLKKEEYDILVTKATAFNIAEERKKALIAEVSAAEKAIKTKEETIKEVASLKSEVTELESDIENLIEQKANLEYYQKAMNIHADTLSLLSEIANYSEENRKLKEQNSLLIKVLKSIEKLIENTKIKQIIHKAIVAVEEKQPQDTQHHIHNIEF